MSESSGDFRSRVQDAHRLQKSSEAQLQRATEHFFKSPAIKVIISMIPPTEPPELLEQLLKSALEEGFNFGQSVAAQDFALMLFETFPDKNGG